jgi:uncharacterized protein YbjT (DUF2867 family)
MRTALIAGASGHLGGNLLRQLLETREYERVVVVVRETLPFAHPKLEQVVVDFAALEKAAADLRCDDAFCCLGTAGKQDSPEIFRAANQTAVIAFAWAARRNGAERFFIVSALAANAESRIFHRRVKGETEEALKVLGFSTLAIFRAGWLLGPRPHVRWCEHIAAALMWLAEPLLVGRLRKYRAIEASVVARAMVRASFGGPGQGVLVFPADEIQDLGAFGA